ncbi:hypothetical protein BgiBS90_022989, partial [Biomphalaria glabrata]
MLIAWVTKSPSDSPVHLIPSSALPRSTLRLSTFSLKWSCVDWVKRTEEEDLARSHDT